MAFEYTIIREFNKEHEKVRRKGIAEGKAEGKVEDRIEATLELLEDLGKIPEELAHKIRNPNDLDILRRWHKFAASATTIEEFKEKAAP